MDSSFNDIAWAGITPAVLPTQQPYGFENYLATGVGLTQQELGALALGAPITPGVISENQLFDWGRATDPQAGVSITGLQEEGIGVFGSEGSLSDPGTRVGCVPCPPIPPTPCDSPTPCGCDCETVKICIDGKVDFTAPLRTAEVPSGAGFDTAGNLRWSNNSAAVGGVNAGNGWSLNGASKLVLRQSDFLGPTSIALPFNGIDVRTFQRSATDPNLFLRAVSSGPTDTIVRVGNELHYKTLEGTTIRFVDFTAANASTQRGQYLGESDAAGNRIDATLNANGSIAELRSYQAGSSTADEVQKFSYIGSTTTNPGRVSEIRVERSDGPLLRRSAFTYFTTTTKDAAGVVIGRAADLKSVVNYDGNGALLDQSAFRYSTDSRGRSLLAYVFGSEDTRRISAAGLNIDTASNSQLAPFARDGFGYDSQNRMISRAEQGTGCSTCTGGIGTTSYSYATNANAPAGFNSWKYKTTALGPDGNETITYSNAYGQTMLKVFRDLVDPANPALVGKQWGEFTAFDTTTGLTVLQAKPESVLLPANLGTLEQYADLLHMVNGNYEYLSDTEGPITRTAYGTSTSATEISAGNVAGFVSDVALTRGELGSTIPQMEMKYFERSVSLAGETSTVTPLAAQTRFRNDDGTGAETTTYSYQWYLNSNQAYSITTTLPVVGADQNGPGTAAVNTQVFNQVGQEIWSKDADGFLIYTAYDPLSGSVQKRIEDVNTSLTGSFTDLPSGWSTPAGGGLQLTTTYNLDGLGRVTKEIDPNGNSDYMVYNDVNHSVRMYQGWDPSAGQPTGPTRQSRMDLSGSYTETLTMSATPNTIGGAPTGTEPISNLESLSRTYTNSAGQVIYRDDYFDLTGITWSTAPNLGVEGTNFYRTRFSYNNQGLVEREQSPTGTITHSVYDGARRLSSTWIGTNDTTANGQKWSPSNNTGSSNMVQVAAYTYDDNGVGNSNLTQSVALPGIGANRVNEFAYDWRDRLVASKYGVEATEADSVNRQVIYREYDNLNEMITTSRYDGDGVNIYLDVDANGVPDRPAPADRRRYSRFLYDNQGRQFRSQEYLVDQRSGDVVDLKLQNDWFYDKRGNTIQTVVPNGPANQFVYDGAGRQSVRYTLGNVSSGSWADAGSLTNSVVLEQLEFAYDANGNAIQSAWRQRFHDANPTATGALGTASSGIQARVSFSTNYYDAADRLTASLDLGTNGGNAYTRPATAPARSDTELVTSYSYDSAGYVLDVTDPRALISRTLYDDLGRQTRTIANYTGGAPGSTTDVTTQYTYDGSNHLLTLTAVQPAGTPSQTTQYLYQARTSTGSAINSNDLLTETRYPDPITGLASSTERELYTVNALGDRLTSSDRNGSTHTYGYDVLGRRLSDAVSTLGAGVDGAVRRLEVGYDGAGMAALFTSFDAASGGNVLNQTGRIYNGFGQLTVDLQSHSAAVDLATTPKVSYGYSLTSGGSGNHSRLTGISYPNGRLMSYGYDAGIDSAISRLSRISGPAAGGGTGSTDLETYKYLGLGTVVERNRPESGVNLTYVSQNNSTGDAGDQYTGLDRFGRVVDQRWISGSGLAATDVDRYGYSYDRNSNRLTRSNALNGAFSESYSYDGLNQLVDYARAGGGTGPQNQQWAFDALGNWSTLTTDGTPESRTHNAQNELTSVAGTGLTYDRNGNLTTDETGRLLMYDAWNRLVQVSTGGGSQLAAYQYDALNQRIVETTGAGLAPVVRDLFYSDQWQVLEQRIRNGGALGATAEQQFVWSPVYVDALILRERDSDSNGSLEERIYALQDANWNTTAILDATGAVLNRFAYTPYGEVESLAANWSAAAVGTPWAVLFQGLRHEQTTDLMYARSRDYSPILGRFIEIDQIGFLSGDRNWYRFIENSPINGLDPEGQQGILGPCVTLIVGIVAISTAWAIYALNRLCKDHESIADGYWGKNVVKKDIVATYTILEDCEFRNITIATTLITTCDAYGPLDCIKGRFTPRAGRKPRLENCQTIVKGSREVPPPRIWPPLPALPPYVPPGGGNNMPPPTLPGPSPRPPSQSRESPIFRPVYPPGYSRYVPFASRQLLELANNR